MGKKAVVLTGKKVELLVTLPDGTSETVDGAKSIETVGKKELESLVGRFTGKVELSEQKTCERYRMNAETEAQSLPRSGPSQVVTMADFLRGLRIHLEKLSTSPTKTPDEKRSLEDLCDTLGHVLGEPRTAVDTIVDDDSQLGKGSFGTVTAVLAAFGGEKPRWCARKRCSIDRGPEQNAAYFKEVTLLRRCRGPGVVKVFGAVLGEEGFDVFLERCEESVHHYLTREGKAHARLAALWGHQLFAAVDHIQKRNVVHSDLKNLNLLLTSERELKVCDFGCSGRLLKRPAAQLATGKASAEAAFGTLLYAPPSSMTKAEYRAALKLGPTATKGIPEDAEEEGQEKVTRRDDVYSAAQAVWEMATLMPHSLQCLVVEPEFKAHPDVLKVLPIQPDALARLKQDKRAWLAWTRYLAKRAAPGLGAKKDDLPLAALLQDCLEVNSGDRPYAAEVAVRLEEFSKRPSGA